MSNFTNSTAKVHHQQVDDHLFNQMSAQALFEKYREIGFLYAAKMELLAPYFQAITQNWERLLESKEDLLWVLTNDHLHHDDFASISAWRQSNHGLIAQHLVSSGNPFLSLKLMLAAQVRASNDPGIKSSQNWFRPNNRYAYRVFASMIDKLGPSQASLRLFQYLHLPIQDIVEVKSDSYMAEEVDGIDLPFIQFVNQTYGEVFTKAEELDREDIRLDEIGAVYGRYGLERSRKIFKIKDADNQMVAAVVANRAPLGLNFSFLENRCYYIIQESLEPKEREQVVKLMNATVKEYYDDLELKAVPIVTDEATAQELIGQNATPIRAYMQSIWLREGFDAWFDHIDAFLSRIERRRK